MAGLFASEPQNSPYRRREIAFANFSSRVFAKNAQTWGIIMFIVGIDLGNEYSQVSYYNFASAEPESVVFQTPGESFRVPTVVLKERNKEHGWMAGELALSCNLLGEGTLFDKLLDAVKQKEPIVKEDVTVMPVQLIQVYLTFLLQSAVRAFGKDEEPDKLCITLADYNIDLLKGIDAALGLMGIPEEKVIFSSHVESYVYYALSQKSELWKNDNFLFDYGRDGLYCCRMVTVPDRGKRIVMTRCSDLRDKVPYTTDMEKLEELLLYWAQNEFDKKMISTVYLTGEGFEGDFNCERFINYICNRRRVFAGQNLYAKGACYQAYEMSAGDNFKDFIIGCNERITTGIEMKICDRGVDKILRLVRPGINWYKAGCSYDFIVDDCNMVELFLSPVDSKDKQLVKISLADFPVRENKASRITLTLDFTSDTRCHLTITDRGFGEFIKSSGRVISEDILL